MPKERDIKKPSSKKAPQISRREFAVGSMAILGAYSAEETEKVPPLSPEAEAMKLEISDEIRSFMQVRHILDEDVKRVIDYAEKTDDKLYKPGRNVFLAKLRVKEVYFYAEYSPIEDGFRIHTAYSHRFLMEENQP
jgi:hypothetical protein